MDPAFARLLLILGAYLVGAIPFGLLIAKSKGIDIRKHGSGNIGATNVGRVLGKKFFAICFTLDMLKGLAPTLAFGLVSGIIGSDEHVSPADYWWWLGAMVAPVLGHMFSPFIGFKGGKGVATGLGSLLAVFPVMTIAAGVALAVFLTTLKLSRYVGLSSSLASLSLPITTAVLVFVVGDGYAAAWPTVVASAALAAVVIVKHRGNLSRTFKGTEPKAGSPRAASETIESTSNAR
ncbi:MAG: glycerol-3-phosphate 1-O-acyltransferase PlsY [Phycisphaerales bacterium]